jgi:hypothetical protein
MVVNPSFFACRGRMVASFIRDGNVENRGSTLVRPERRLNRTGDNSWYGKGQ